jgi:hypothetical protein
METRNFELLCKILIMQVGKICRLEVRHFRHFSRIEVCGMVRIHASYMTKIQNFCCTFLHVKSAALRFQKVQEKHENENATSYIYRRSYKVHFHFSRSGKYLRNLSELEEMILNKNVVRETLDLSS